MTIQQLEYILAVDRYRHFARAAEHCGVTQPTLSAMIQKLEDELGVKIFDRRIQPVIPTNIGEKIIEQAKQIQAQVAQVKEIIYEEKHLVNGTFKLAVLPTIAPYLLPRFFPQLKDKYPGIDIRVIEKKTHEVIAGLLNEEFDAAIIASYPDSPHLSGEILFYEEFLGYVSAKETIFKNELIRTSDVSGTRLWLLDEGHCFRDQLMRFCQMETVKSNQMTYQLGSLETFMRMVENGQGMTFIPELAALQLNDGQKKFVRPFAIPRPTRSIVLTTRKDYIRKSLLEVIKKEVQQSIPNEMLTLQVGQTLV